MAALMLTAATACTGDNEPLQNNDVPPTGRPVTITATYQGAGTPDGTDAQTRTNYERNDNTVKVTWKAGDKIYIINSENLKEGNTLTEVGFEEFTLEGEGGEATGTFKNASSNLDMNKKLYAVYCGDNAPGKISVITTKGFSGDIKAYTFPMTGQRQTSNNNTGHLADYDLMCAIENTNAATKSFKFKHVNAILHLRLKFPNNIKHTVKEVKVTCSAKTFAPLITVNPAMEKIHIIDNAVESYSLKYGSNDNGATVTSGNPVLAFMMVGARPIYANGEITITVTCADGTYSTKITPSKAFSMNAGTLNTIEATLTKDTN